MRGWAIEKSFKMGLYKLSSLLKMSCDFSFDIWSVFIYYYIDVNENIKHSKWRKNPQKNHIYTHYIIL